jgi:phage baseplate assembly protein V
MDLNAQLARLLAPITTRIRMMISRAVIKTIDDSTKIQTLRIKLLTDELHDGAEHYQTYGFTSYPFPGMEALVCCVEGIRANPVVVAIGDRKFRLKSLETGEVALYTDEGDTLIFKRGRKIVATTTTFEVNADSINLNASGDINMKAGQSINMETQLIKLIAPETSATGHMTVSNGLTWGATAEGINGASAVIKKLQVQETSTASDHISAGKSGATHTHKDSEGGNTGQPL